MNKSAGMVPFAIAFDKAGRMLVAEAAKCTVSTYKVRRNGELQVLLRRHFVWRDLAAVWSGDCFPC
ncbi:hypothetical protein [Streptomyces avermitilis]|uniref:hypothetical protein n=1 Tax=Streptomyces avermitilis TaxID=33903 RepID=UPI0033F60C2D